MSDQFSSLLKIAVVSFMVTLLWAASISFTYWDTHRRGLSARETLKWLAAVIFLPFIGWIAYLRKRNTPLLPPLKIKQNTPKTRRVTALRPPVARKRQMSTISASDLDIQVVHEAKRTLPGMAQPLQASRYSVTITSGPEPVREFIIERIPARIGRGSEAQIRLDRDLGVSRKQAEVYEQGKLLRIRDLQSTHGTQVNGLRIDDRSLQPGDRIQVGSSILMIRKIKD
jgi:hypothetical protein